LSDEDGDLLSDLFFSCLKGLQVVLTRIINRDTQPFPHSFHIHILSATGKMLASAGVMQEEKELTHPLG
jgi:hypothetical protein